MISRCAADLESLNLSRLTHRPRVEVLTADARLDALPEAVVVADAGGRVTWTNQRAELLFGYTRTELAELTLEQLEPGRANAPALKARHHDGHLFPVATSVGLLESGGNPGKATRGGGHVVCRSTLIRRVWGDADAATKHDLRVFVGRVRSKLAQLGDSPTILTEHGIGYRIAPS
jgi:PAS domain-containing protein